MNRSVSITELLIVSIILFSCSQRKSERVHADKALSLLEIPEISSPVTIDGKPDEIFWKSAVSMSLESKEFYNHDTAGDLKAASCEGYLYLAASMPESERLVVHSVGINPSWWREDMIRWMFRFRSPVSGSNSVILLTINPFGAVSMASVRDIYNINKNDFLSLAPVSWSEEIAARAIIENDHWTIEAALPLKYLDTLGFLSAERVRVQRVNSPEINWYWPAVNEQISYKLLKGNKITLPVLKNADEPANSLSDDKRQAPSGPLAEEVFSLPRQAWSDEEQKSLGVSRMLENFIRTRITQGAYDERDAWQEVKTVGDWENFRDKRRAALLDWVGPLPERTPLNQVVTSRIDQGKGFVIENLVFESRPGLLVTANLYLPDKPKGKIPAIVVVHSHHAPKTQSELQDMGMTWARAGTAVLIMDQLCAGERIQSQPWSREGYYGRYALGNQLYLAGESLIKWMAWDIIRGIDLLTERKYIDAERIVLMGAVAGGGDPAALTANLDPRIAAVIPFNFGEAGPEEHYTEGPRPYDFETADPGWAFWETTRNLPKSVSGQFFPWFICASVAPRNFVYSFEIGWPATVEAEPAWARYKKVFGLYGAEDHLASVDGFGPFPGPGECTNVGTFLRNRIYPILYKWLDIPVPETEYHNVLHESALMSLTPAVTGERNLQTASAVCLELVENRLSLSLAKRSEFQHDERAATLRDDLEQKLGDIDPEETSRVTGLWKRKFSKFTMEAFSVETDPGILLPVILLTPENASSHHPAVIGLAEGGKEKFFSFRSNEIAALLSDGITVCLPDVRGCGELAYTDSRGPGAMSLAATELMLGGTLTGSRLKDTRTLFRWLAGRSDIDAENIALWGDSFAEPNAPDFRFYQSPGQQQGPVPQRQSEPLGALLAILTALYEEDVKAIACSGGLISFSSVLEDNFCLVPQDVIVPGVLEIADIRDIVEVIAPRPVLLANLVDGLNQKTSIGMMEEEYGKNIQNLTITEKEENYVFSKWFASWCK